ncbi:energy-coupling factor ABC transporter ATP-binding protein [Candidatus Harpocratesius sp.]
MKHEINDSPSPIIEFHNVSFSYEKSRILYENLNFTINKGEILGIAGNSGSGKTTLAYLIKGIIPHAIKGSRYSGEIIVDGHLVHKTKLASLAQTTGMVFQDLNAQLFSNTVLDEVKFGLLNLKMNPKLALDALQNLNIIDLKDRIPMNLSAGQKQRVILASIIALQPKILILDEPSIHLDYQNKIALMRWLTRLNLEMNMTILIASNDPWLIGQMCEEILYIKDHQISRRLKSELMRKRSLWMWNYAT